LNAARIVYVVDEDGPICRYGFAYGTLAEHAESGEERFTVQWDRSEDNVWYHPRIFAAAEDASQAWISFVPDASEKIRESIKSGDGCRDEQEMKGLLGAASCLDVRDDEQSACNCDRVFCNRRNEVRQVCLEHYCTTYVISGKRPSDCAY
jgi:hypothetical protein